MKALPLLCIFSLLWVSCYAQTESSERRIISDDEGLLYLGIAGFCLIVIIVGIQLSFVGAYLLRWQVPRFQKWFRPSDFNEADIIVDLNIETGVDNLVHYPGLRTVNDIVEEPVVMKGPCDLLSRTLDGEEKVEGDYKDLHVSLYPGFICLAHSDVEVPYAVLPMEVILGAEVIDEKKGQWQVTFQRNDQKKLRWVFVNSKHSVIAPVWVRHIELCCEHFGGTRTASFSTEGNFWEEPNALLLTAIAAQPGWTNPLHNMLREQRDEHRQIVNESQPEVRVQRLLSHTLNNEEEYLVEEANRVAPFWRKIVSADGKFRYFNLETKQASFVKPALAGNIPLMSDEEAAFFHAALKPKAIPTGLVPEEKKSQKELGSPSQEVPVTFRTDSEVGTL